MVSGSHKNRWKEDEVSKQMLNTVLNNMFESHSTLKWALGEFFVDKGSGFPVVLSCHGSWWPLTIHDYHQNYPSPKTIHSCFFPSNFPIPHSSCCWQFHQRGTDSCSKSHGGWMTGLDRVNDKQLPTFPLVRSEFWGGPQRDHFWGGRSDSDRAANGRVW